jgi:ornithine carbamoyltransferase
MEHFVNFKDFSPDYLDGIIGKAIEIKKSPEQYANVLAGKKMYMLFQKTSTRTALSFAFGMTGLSGEYFMQKWDDSNFAVGDIQDEVRYVSRNVDVIMARLKKNEDINLMAKYATVPVINGCCNKYHPCQAMADLMTVREIFGNLNVTLLYVGVANNVLNSLMDSLPRMGGQLLAVTPVINEASIDHELYRSAQKTGKFRDIGGGNPSIHDLKDAVKETDVIYTDTWIDMEFINDEKFADLKKERVDKMIPFQINSQLLKGSKAIVMHDMPIHAEYEISRETVEANIGTILQQAENRKWVQMAILMKLLGA